MEKLLDSRADAPRFLPLSSFVYCSAALVVKLDDRQPGNDVCGQSSYMPSTVIL